MNTPLTLQKLSSGVLYIVMCMKIGENKFNLIVIRSIIHIPQLLISHIMGVLLYECVIVQK